MSEGHVYHEGLPGYDERQIWFDGCEDCERRGADVPASVYLLDNERLARAFFRAIAFSNDRDDTTGPISDAERPLLEFLRAVHYVNRHMGFSGIFMFGKNESRVET